MAAIRSLICSFVLLGTLSSADCFAIVPARILGSPQAPNLTISSYNKVIAANRLNRSELALRYIERGQEYGRLFRYQDAVNDFSEAIAISPTSQAYVHRAVAYARLERYQQAFEDFDRALKLDGANLSALVNRAGLFFLRGEYAQAAQDFKRYLQFRPNDMYRMLWVYLAETNAGTDVTSIRKYLPNTNLQRWPGAMLQLYLGDVTLEQLQISLKPVLSSWDARHRCEVYFYIAQYLLLHGKQSQALRYFDQAVRTKAKNLLEYEFSMSYLRKLS